MKNWSEYALSIKASIKKAVNKSWEQEWERVQNNKLRNIKDNVKPFLTSTCKYREWERKLSRLRLGHTRITHEYLMSGGHRPYCPDCIVPLTVEHIIVECPNYANSRGRYLGGNRTLRSVLDDTGPVQAAGPLYMFLKDIDIFSRI